MRKQSDLSKIYFPAMLKYGAIFSDLMKNKETPKVPLFLLHTFYCLFCTYVLCFTKASHQIANQFSHQ